MKKLALVLAAFAALSSSAFAAKETVIKIGTKGEEMAFDKKEFNLKAGEKVTVEFKNNSGSLQHNFVLTKPGQADKVMNDSIVAGAANNWSSNGPEVIAKSAKLVDPKKTDKISFTAPTEKGDYPFLCTFPGHGAMMRGVAHVK